MPTVEYEVSPNPRAHLFRVTCTLSEPDPDGQVLTLPAWIPGSYLIRDFARHVLSVTATAGDRPVAVVKRDKQSWRCAPCKGSLAVTCEVYARDESVRAAYLDHRRAFFNGTSLFLRPLGRETVPCRVHLVPPEEGEGWRTATTLTPESVDDNGFGSYRARDYDELIDHPVAMATALETVSFEVRGVPHGIVLIGRHDADRARLAEDLARVCETHVDLFGALPVSRCLFLAQLSAEGYGGLEHRDCAVLAVARDALPAAGQERTRPDAYLELLGLCSHEYFHLWHVKRIRPATVADSDLTAEAYFSDLWAYEGVTSYYDDLALVRAGLLPPAAYLNRLARTATRLQRHPGRLRQSLAESSFDAWIKFYRPDENTPNAVVSYYGKGALVALCLDLTLRLRTEGHTSLDDVMRAAWARFGATGQPVPENGFEALAAEVSGLDLTDFFDTYIRGTDDPPLDALLPAFGVDCRRIPMDAGDGADFALAQGLYVAPERNGGARIRHVLAGSTAEATGLCPDDVVVAVEGLRVTRDNLDLRLRRQVAAREARLHVFRDDELLCLNLPLQPVPATGWRLALDAEGGSDATNRRRAWLGA